MLRLHPWLLRLPLQTLASQCFLSAPDRSRTCDLRYRKPALHHIWGCILRIWGLISQIWGIPRIERKPHGYSGWLLKEEKMSRSVEPKEYVRSSVVIEPTTGCWNWSKSIRSNGYPLCQRRDWRGSAHRFSYTHFV